MEKLLISACLLGENCRWDGGNNALPAEILAALRQRFALLPVCPERDGGMSTPRVPSERRGTAVVSRTGEDVTEYFSRGAECALQTARAGGCSVALLKERSPSCGSGRIYDGSFTGTLVPSDGLAAERLRAAGLRVLGESRVGELLYENHTDTPFASD